MKDFDNNQEQQVSSDSEERHWIPWGLASLRAHRTPLLLWAFGLNFIAISGITIGAFAIKTSPNLANVAWASATTTTSDLSLPLVDFQNADSSECIDEILKMTTPPEITAHVWLGLRGYYGECQITGSTTQGGSIDGDDDTTTISSMTHPHSDTFCSARSGNLSVASVVENDLMMQDELLLLQLPFSGGEDCNNTPPPKYLWNCELLTGTIDDDSRPNQQKECSACKDIQRSCMGTLLSSAVFGVFPLVLTIRRVCSAKREKLLRLRTLFFSGLAIIFGFTAFIRFHFRCVHTIPPAWYAVVWQQQQQQLPSSSSLCASVASAASSPCTKPFLVSVPMEMKLHMGGKIVIIAAVLKVAYFTLHLITPPHNIHHDDQDDDDYNNNKGMIPGERQHLLSSSFTSVNKSSSSNCTTDIESTSTGTATLYDLNDSKRYYRTHRNSSNGWTVATTRSSSSSSSPSKKRKSSFASAVQQQQQQEIKPNYDSPNPFAVLSGDEEQDSSTDDSSSGSGDELSPTPKTTTARVQLYQNPALSAV